MKEPLLIGLAGFARSGKTTIANILEREHSFSHYSFASSIRRFTHHFFSELLPGFDLERDKTLPFVELAGVTPRKFMQCIGTEGGRHAVHPDLWVMHTMARIANDRLIGPRSAVISDVRFPNEAEAIRDAGGFVLWVNRSGCDPAEHASEAGLPAHLCDAVILNDGVLERMPEYVGALVANLALWKALQSPYNPQETPPCD